MEAPPKRPVQNIFSVTVPKDFRIQTKVAKNNLTVETSDEAEKRYASTVSSKLNTIFSPSVMRFRNSINLLSTPKLSAMGKLNSENKFERIFLSMDKNISKFDLDENDEEIVKKLNDSFEMEIEDQKNVDLVGQNAVNTYYSYYKRLDKIKDKNKFSVTNESSHTAMLSKTESDFLLPTKLGVIKYAGEENRIKINNFKYGDKYASMISEGIKHLPKLTHFNFADNRFTQAGAKVLLSQMGKNTKSIDLTSNSIGYIGCENIYNILISRDCRIEELNLEDNKLGDKAVKVICEGLGSNVYLKRLNLSKNYLTNNIGESIKSVLIKNSTLVELYLHWNQIKGIGGQKIFQGLLENDTLLVFDISWNSLGGNNPTIAPNIVEVLQKNERLMHLDLSNNYFTLEESKMIAAGLENNHTLFGFHFVGNYGHVDAKGFLVVPHDASKDISEMHLKQRISGFNVTKPTVNKKKHMEEVRDPCWICDGWSDFKFEWIPGTSGDCDFEPIYVHFEFDGYEAHYMGKITKGFKFVYERMIPPGKMTFFFTANKSQTHSLAYPAYDEINSIIHHVKMQRKVIEVSIERRNLLETPINFGGLTYFHSNAYAPRVKDQLYDPPKKKKAKRVWSFPISIFKDWKKDDEEMLKKCFEFDWSCGRIPRVIKKEDDLEKVKKQLYAVYRQYKETYKYIASLSPSGEVWSISQLPFTDFINESNIIDNKFLKLSDVDIKFIATLSSGEKSNPRNPERSLVRYQLMEVMVRIAEARYVASGVVQTFSEAMEICIKDNLMPIYNKYNAQIWRDEKYWCEACDDALKYYKCVLDNVYARYSVKKVKPGMKKFMCLEEFHDIFKHANLLDENFVERDIYIAFNLAMMTQVDELTVDRIFQMTFVEFLEALSRCADKLSLPKIGSNPAVEMTLEEKKAQPLCYKIEALLVHLVKHCTDVLFKEGFVFPTTSIFDKAVEDEYEEIDSP